MPLANARGISFLIIHYLLKPGTKNQELGTFFFRLPASVFNTLFITRASGFLIRKGEAEGCTFPWYTFCPDNTSMHIYEFLTEQQTEAGTFFF